MTNPPLKKHLLAESHRRQFAGEDYQGVAIEIAEEMALNLTTSSSLNYSPLPNRDASAESAKQQVGGRTNFVHAGRAAADGGDTASAA